MRVLSGIIVVAALFLGSAFWQVPQVSPSSASHIALPQAEGGNCSVSGHGDHPALIRGERTWESPFLLPVPERESALPQSPLLRTYCRWSRSSFS